MWSSLWHYSLCHDFLYFLRNSHQKILLYSHQECGNLLFFASESFCTSFLSLLFLNGSSPRRRDKVAKWFTAVSHKETWDKSYLYAHEIEMQRKQLWFTPNSLQIYDENKKYWLMGLKIFENNFKVNPWMSIIIDVPLGHIFITVSTPLLSKSSKLQLSPVGQRYYQLKFSLLKHLFPYMFTNAQQQNTHLIPTFPCSYRHWVHPTYAFWEAWNSSCAQSMWSVYIGDWFCVKQF